MGDAHPIFLAEYDPGWPRAYAEEATLLRSLFGDELVTRIEHIGSTAVPGLAAKPVIDILVEVTSLEAAEREMIPSLEERGYRHDWYKGHLFFFKGYASNAPLKYHIHVGPSDGPLMDCLLFRECLRNDAETARAYEDLKRYLAEQYRNDREAYTESKSGFVTETTERARAEQEESRNGR